MKNTAVLSHELCTFVSSLRSGRSPRGNRMIRVAVARVHILIIVRSRLRRPETDRERERERGKKEKLMTFLRFLLLD